jgi:hypothetical protein
VVDDIIPSEIAGLRLDVFLDERSEGRSGDGIA